jgi:hypothetical protein
MPKCKEKRTMTTADHNRDNFLHWIEEHPETEGPLAASPRAIKTKQQRDRLIRIEMMLDELMKLKHNVVEGRKNYAENL